MVRWKGGHCPKCGRPIAQKIGEPAKPCPDCTAALAAPAVQGEPIAWVTADTVDGQAVNGKPRRIWWENNEGVGMPIYAAPQPAPDVTPLVEALEDCITSIEPYDDIKPRDWKTDRESLRRVYQSARAALAAYRKGGEV